MAGPREPSRRDAPPAEYQDESLSQWVRRQGDPARRRSRSMVFEPDGSIAAGARQTRSRVSHVQAVVLDLLREHGPSTHDELVGFYEGAVTGRFAPPVSPSSVRSRCAELVRAGLVRPSSTVKRSRYGNPAAAWEVVPGPSGDAA